MKKKIPLEQRTTNFLIAACAMNKIMPSMQTFDILQTRSESKSEVSRNKYTTPSVAKRFKPRALRPSKVKYLMRDGIACQTS